MNNLLTSTCSGSYTSFSHTHTLSSPYIITFSHTHNSFCDSGVSASQLQVFNHHSNPQAFRDLFLSVWLLIFPTEPFQASWMAATCTLLDDMLAQDKELLLTAGAFGNRAFKYKLQLLENIDSPSSPLFVLPSLSRLNHCFWLLDEAMWLLRLFGFLFWYANTCFAQQLRCGGYMGSLCPYTYFVGLCVCHSVFEDLVRQKNSLGITLVDHKDWQLARQISMSPGSRRNRFFAYSLLFCCLISFFFFCCDLVLKKLASVLSCLCDTMFDAYGSCTPSYAWTIVGFA